MSSLTNYIYTLRYLRSAQVFGRIWFKLRRPRADVRPAPPLRQLSNTYVAPIPRPASMLGPGRFRLLNQEDDCLDAGAWQGHGRARLWTYNLHYFDDLAAADATARHSWHQELMDRWIDENPPGVGVGWDPYPVSRRMVNWVKWSLTGNSMTDKARQSLAVQARWLEQRIEFHLQGNHVFANAKALAHAGLYFEGTEADRWLQRGLSLTQTELVKQVLADGGHFERSPMYHAAFLEDLLDTMGIMQSFGRAVPAAWRGTAARMVVWLEAMSHPDGGIAFFNDAAFGIAPSLEQLRDYAHRLNVSLDPGVRSGLHPLMPSGYVSVNSPPFFLVCDVAPVGPDHLPAHAHADTLSFEMSFKGRRVLVNSGTSEYGLSAERQRQRGTTAHNTLVLDGADSSEVWAGFRVARRARAVLLSARAEEQQFIIAGEHSGYRRLRGRNVHRRVWTLDPRELRIDDAVEGPFSTAKCYFHLHPEIHVHRVDGANLLLTDTLGVILEMRFEGAADVDVVESSWHPEFGISVINRCVVARFEGRRLVTQFAQAS